MKKSLIFLSIFTALSVTSCGSPDIDYSKIALDYGYVYKDGITSESQTRLYYGELVSKITNKETFVLLLHNNTGCTCWSDLFFVAKKFMNKYNVMFNSFVTNDFAGQNSYGIYAGVGQELPGIVFIKKGVPIRTILYGEVCGTINEKIFKNEKSFEDYMLDNIHLPKMYYIDKETLESKMSDTSLEFNLYVALKGCGDCAAVYREYISSWAEKNIETTITDKLYIFDIYPYENNEETPNIRDFCWLSPMYNEKFGYQNTKHGYVPTFQRWKNGEVIDMITVLNDFADSNTGEVLSYFSQTRINNSPILSAASYHAYDKEIIDTSLINPWGTVVQEKQLEWHLPAVKLFFDTYVK